MWAGLSTASSGAGRLMEALASTHGGGAAACLEAVAHPGQGGQAAAGVLAAPHSRAGPDDLRASAAGKGHQPGTAAACPQTGPMQYRGRTKSNARTLPARAPASPCPGCKQSLQRRRTVEVLEAGTGPRPGLHAAQLKSAGMVGGGKRARCQPNEQRLPTSSISIRAAALPAQALRRPVSCSLSCTPGAAQSAHLSPARSSWMGAWGWFPPR